MKRRPLPVAAALTATAVLLLTACGNEGGENPGADFDSGSPEAPVSRSPSQDVDRPDLSLPGDVTEVFEDNKAAAVTLCSDESKAFNRFLKTNKVDRNAPSDNSYVYYVSRLTLNAKGVWVTTDSVSKRGSEMCTP